MRLHNEIHNSVELWMSADTTIQCVVYELFILLTNTHPAALEKRISNFKISNTHFDK